MFWECLVCTWYRSVHTSMYLVCTWMYHTEPFLQDFLKHCVMQTRRWQMSSSSIQIWTVTLTTSQAHLHHSAQPQLCGIRQNGSLAGAWRNAQSQKKRDPGTDRHVAKGACGCIMPVSPTLWGWWTSLQVRISTFSVLMIRYECVCTQFAPVHTSMYQVCTSMYKNIDGTYQYVPSMY